MFFILFCFFIPSPWRLSCLRVSLPLVSYVISHALTSMQFCQFGVYLCLEVSFSLTLLGKKLWSVWYCCFHTEEFRCQIEQCTYSPSNLSGYILIGRSILCFWRTNLQKEESCIVAKENLKIQLDCKYCRDTFHGLQKAQGHSSEWGDLPNASYLGIKS